MLIMIVIYCNWLAHLQYIFFSNYFDGSILHVLVIGLVICIK